jgi:hypothetical protein
MMLWLISQQVLGNLHMTSTASLVHLSPIQCILDIVPLVEGGWPSLKLTVHLRLLLRNLIVILFSKDIYIEREGEKGDRIAIEGNIALCDMVRQTSERFEAASVQTSCCQIKEIAKCISTLHPILRRQT